MTAASHTAEPPLLDRALSVRALARRWRVGTAKVLALVRRGVLQAFDTGLGTGRKQLRFAPEAIRAAEQKLAVKPKKPRKQQRDRDGIDPEVRRMLGLDQ